MQCNVLGHLLSLLYINGILKFIRLGTLLLFIGDTKIVYFSKAGLFNCTPAFISDDLKFLDNWCSKSGSIRENNKYEQHFTVCSLCR